MYPICVEESAHCDGGACIFAKFERLQRKHHPFYFAYVYKSVETDIQCNFFRVKIYFNENRITHFPHLC